MNWIGVGLIGGVVGIDATSFAQTMVSRPLIASTLVGLLLGRPEEGAMLGSILELFALVILPVGAARYPESGTAAVAASAAYLSVTQVVSPSVMLLAVLFALLWERVSGYSVIADRHFNEQYVALAPLTTPAQLERRHVLAIVVDFVRAVLLTLLGVLIGTSSLRLLSELWGMSASVAPAILSIGMSCMVGAALPLFGGVHTRKAALLTGVVCGSLIVLFR